MKNKILFTLIISSLFLFSCNQDDISKNNDSGVKNIILLIGDGMGPVQVYSALTVSTDSLNLQRMPFSGFVITRPITNYITDSAAGGTALATGNKTKNGRIAQDTLGNDLKTILEIAQEHNLSTGVISTSSVTHATPASFVAHEPSRNNYENIAYDFVNSKIDVFIGGGYDHFAKRSDQLNLIDSLEAREFQVTVNMNELQDISQGKVAALLSEMHMPSIIDGRGDMLPKATEKAIELLSDNSKGFFLMVEGSQIDWGGHANNSEYVVTETIDFDQAVGKALSYARKDGNTLVIVTADHETGGMTLTGGSLENHKISATFSTGSHTAAMVPVFAYGPGAENFTGIMDNTEIFELMMQLYDFNK